MILMIPDDTSLSQCDIYIERGGYDFDAVYNIGAKFDKQN